jgi:hypothetical protein
MTSRSCRSLRVIVNATTHTDPTPDADDLVPLAEVPATVYVEVYRYAQGPTKPGKPWFRRAVQLAWTLGYRAGVATEAARRMRYEKETTDA